MPDFKQHTVSSIFGLIALPLLVLSLILAAGSIDFLRSSHTVQGVISKVLVRGTTTNRKILVEAPPTGARGDYYPVISYTVGDSTYSFRQKVSEPYPPYAGEVRSILVSTANPSIAKTRHFSQFWLAPLILFLFAAAFGSGAYFVRGIESADLEERKFLLDRAPRIRSMRLSIQENILDSNPEGKRSRYITAEFAVDGKVFTARSKPLTGDIVLPTSVAIAYDPNDPTSCLILEEQE